MSLKQSEKAKSRWLRGEGSGFKKGNKLAEHPRAIATRFKKGLIPWISGKNNPSAKNNPQVFKKGMKPWNNDKKIWQGSKSDYQKIHYWVKVKKGKRRKCNECSSKFNLVWANISQKYLWDLNDWECLCRSCHIKGDMKFIKNNYGKQ